MVTFAYLLTLLLVNGLFYLFDSIIFSRTFNQSLGNAYISEAGPEKSFLVIIILFGLLWSIVVDIRIKKRKVAKNNN